MTDGMADDNQVPIIDVGPFLAGTEEGIAQVAAEVDRACRDIGFFQIVGHGVPTEQIDAVYGTARAFFAQPDDQKAEAAQ
ncbi:MAG: 2-oxoglutarate and iron-dependent oxygenase domain-containing protein, partial [Actinomycetota bacterium]